ncbi:helix-turn-helix transcriptional regulator [Pedobacter sp. N36a]|uniref:helix-turn-helix domain-containing protein n=1 Tax=Pedobacter sp. N36a TaxID=2767996 RepID=UPI0016570F2B|nr:helix-turn-helix transcriptional regulator [Pedobacter sp. N36a]MBC8987531.1 helix-turn-helix transcriptional regulator [Pedobacter sp. N36a]
MIKKPHLGRNLSRIRGYYGMKQTTLAKALGISQQAVSKMEQRNNIGDDSLLRIAKILNVKLSLFKKLNPELGVQNISSRHDIENNSDMGLIIQLIKRLVEKDKKDQ